MIRVTNTLTGEKEPFQPGGDVVSMYVCGITPYAEAHVGHAMSYILFDVIRRYLEYRGYRVRYIQNFTDIDDKIIDRASRLGISARALAERYIEEYFRDLDGLNVRQADVYPRATQEIDQIVELVAGLIARDHAYEVNGDVYFRVLSFPEYGKLSHRTLEGMMAGARVQVEAAKEHPMDFALWKAAKPGEPSWLSPWGPGRPGWHIECSAMVLHHLGPTIDLHGGGQDLIFPHHENELAQSECYSGQKPFVRYWLHNGLLQLGEEKMSKSLGNLVTIHEALKAHSPDAIRAFILSSHYRSPLKYSEEGIEAAQRGLGRLAGAVRGSSGGTGQPVSAESFRQQFETAMDDDFNTPRALAALYDLAREINRGRDAGQTVGEAQTALGELAGVLGLTLKGTGAEGDHLEARPFIDLLVRTRTELRGARLWPLADKIRQELTQLGVTLEDTPAGTIWRSEKP